MCGQKTFYVCKDNPTDEIGKTWRDRQKIIDRTFMMKVYPQSNAYLYITIYKIGTFFSASVLERKKTEEDFKYCKTNMVNEHE